MTVHRTSLALCLALGIALLCPDITLATDLPIYGGLGGQEFRADCPTGSYLVGLSGRTGEWVDNIAPICAPWLVAKQVFGPPSVGPSHGASIGGQEHPADCGVQAGNIHVVQSWKIDILRSDNHYVKHIMAHCLSLSPSASSRVFHFGTKDPYDQNISFGPFGTKPPEQACPAKEAAVGIRGRAGQFVDAIGLICGPLPLGPSAPVMKLPGPLVQGPSPATPINPQTKNMLIPADMFSIIRPASGERVPSGQLIITAMPPKVGATNVTELELSYLDAPAAQRNSYPYVTVFSVDTLKLLQGFPVAPIVTGDYKGRWQVRARSSMKGVPGPWSFPVQFQLIVPQATQSPQQGPLPGSSVLQAPSQNTGAPPKVVHPPARSSGGAANSLMVRPRGTGANDDKGHDMAETEPERGQKP